MTTPNTFTTRAAVVVSNILAGDVHRARIEALGATFTVRDRLEIARACRKWGIDPSTF